MENLLNVVTFNKHVIEVSQIKNFMEIKPKYDPMAHTSHNSIETSEANAAWQPKALVDMDLWLSSTTQN